MTLYKPTHSQLEKLDEILGSLKGRCIGLLGLGVAGRAMAAYLVSQGADVVAADLRTELADDSKLNESLTLRLGPMSEAVKLTSSRSFSITVCNLLAPIFSTF